MRRAGRQPGAALVAALAIAVCLLACGPAWASPAATSPSPSRSGCAETRGALLGDVDGDGRRDRVTLVGTAAGERLCRYMLRVRAAGRGYRARIQGRFTPWDTSVPALRALVRIAPGRGLQVVVDVAHGASTVFAGVFALRGGALRRLSISDLPLPGTFPYLGSLAASAAVDCTAPGSSTVVATSVDHSWTRSGGEVWVVERRIFRLEGERFVLEPGLTEHRRFRRYPRLQLPATPFPSCAVATAAA